MQTLPIAPLDRIEPNRTTLSAHTGVSRATIYRWEHDGIPIESADRAAVALGFHPAELWAEWSVIE